MKNKRIIILIIILILSLLVLLLSFWVTYSIIHKNITNESRELRQEFNQNYENTYGFNYGMNNEDSEVLLFSLNSERTISLWVWTKNIFGQVEITLEDDKRQQYFQISGNSFNEKQDILLTPGDYRFKVRFKNILAGACILGINHSFFYYNQLSMMPDRDCDALPDAIETELGTDPLSADTDNDTLSDYMEVRKYLTNPLTADSDRDGKDDSAWQERREYTYTIQAIVDLRPPFDITDMNDFYQDARVLKNTDDVTQLEVILYPEAKVIINPAEYTIFNNKYTEPTYTKNYSLEMKDKIKSIVKDSQTDIQALIKVLEELNKIKHVHIADDLGLTNDWPINFYVYRDNQGNIIETEYPATTTYSIEQIKERTYFADSMYKHGTHGACGSKSILRGAMLRAAGIQEKTIFTIPLIYSYENDGTIFRIKDKYFIGTVNINMDVVVAIDHFFTLVYIGHQWIRVDNVIDTGIRKQSPSVKLYDCHDPTDFNMTKSCRGETWRQKRPYKYISVIEQEAVY